MNDPCCEHDCNRVLVPTNTPTYPPLTMMVFTEAVTIQTQEEMAHRLYGWLNYQLHWEVWSELRKLFIKS